MQGHIYKMQSAPFLSSPASLSGASEQATMELAMSGNALKTFNRCITCLSRVGSELVFQASPSQLELHTLNASRSAYQSISFAPSFFDTYTVSSSSSNQSNSSPDPLQCSVLIKAVAAVLRTPPVSVDQLSVSLPSPDASKIQFSLLCLHGVKKTYWITCNTESEVQHLSLDRTRFTSSLVVRPRDLARLLSNFQSSLHEITIIATEIASGPSDLPAGDVGGKAVELRSYIDPAKEDSDARLHTQLWIDPVEEFLQYTHSGDPVDVTFGVKELKAFLAFCEGCDVDIHLFFDKAGEPILMAPKFGFDDGSSSDFDASLVLATMLVSQITDANNINNENNNNTDHVPSPRAYQSEPGVPENTNEHTKIWSELSGSGIRNSQLNRENQEREGNPISTMQNGMQGLNVINAPQRTHNLQQGVHNIPQVMEMENNAYSQHHPSNWIDDDDDEDDNDDYDDDELFVQSTPQNYD